MIWPMAKAMCCSCLLQCREAPVVLVAEDANDLSANADRGVEQRADLTRGRVGLQFSRPLVPRSVFDRQERGPADFLEVGGSIGVSELAPRLNPLMLWP
jgi:hypothetical protein